MAVDQFPEPTPGPDLKRLRESQGVKQKDLADKLGIGRVTLHVWERTAEVDPIRTARIQRAIREIVAEATEGIAV